MSSLNSVQTAPINFGSVPDWLTVIVTIITLFIAWKALYTWRKEKHFDLSIQLLSKSRRAVGIIHSLRFSAEFDGEVDPEVMKEHKKLYLTKNEHTDSYVIFKSREMRSNESFSEIPRLRELAWAGFGEDHVFYRFYHKITTIYFELIAGHEELFQLYENKDSYNQEEFIAKTKKLRKFLYHLHDDEVSKELDELENELIKHREMAPYRMR